MSQAFNEQELLERVDGDMDFLSDTLQVLETDGRSLLAQLKEDLSAGDAPAVGRTAHTLKGMISNFCAPSAHGLAMEVEKAGKAGDCVLAAATAARLERDLEALIGELNTFVKARP